MRRDRDIDCQLYALIDDQLDASERAMLLDRIQGDKQLEQRLLRLRRIKNLVSVAHREPPLPGWQPTLADRQLHSGARPLVAGVALLLIGVLSGWGVYTWVARAPVPVFSDIARLSPAAAQTGKVLVHISDMDAGHINTTLDAVERLLESSQREGRRLQVEVIANARGLDLLRAESPYRERIHAITSAHDNVSFLACGIAMQNAHLKEGTDVRLIPEARRVDAALETILKRLKEGWTYVRG